jgi:hypothetical protein
LKFSGFSASRQRFLKTFVFEKSERRQAEFLVKERVPLQRLIRIGVIDEQRAGEVRAILSQAGVDLPVEVKRDWYFLGQ